MATGLMASPLNEEVSRETVSKGGSLVYYGPASKMRREASPSPSSDRVEISRERTTNGGSLVYYGASKVRRFHIAKRWWWDEDNPTCPATQEPKCDTKNGAPNEMCAKLVAELEDNGETDVPKDSLQLCFFPTTGTACCVSWGTKIQEREDRRLKKKDLYENANIILTRCTANGVSGKMQNVELLNTCTEFCLSNRGNKC
ncbi:hypothetical protein EJ08DRAFT_730168 [Tothia fuscella]|uniref:WD-like domain-containing protein n=1 Tax=Tothia fuscella TaxID=1048955 RepID=A0A9P4P167_9PEZI|nr:hypothetical protein EJ08DRAFT_730168 [Tothia fuscella]